MLNKKLPYMFWKNLKSKHGDQQNLWTNATFFFETKFKFNGLVLKMIHLSWLIFMKYFGEASLNYKKNLSNLQSHSKAMTG